MTSEAINAVRAQALALLRPPERRPLSEYIESVLHLPAGLSAQPGRIRLWNFQKAMADAFVDPALTRVTVQKGARLGYSTLLAGCVAHFIKQDAASLLVVLPTDDDSRTFIVSQIESVFAASPELRDAIPIVRTGPYGNFDTMKYRRFPGGSLRVVSARAPRNLRAHSARVLIVDEADGCQPTVEGNPIMLAERRTLSFDNRKIIIGSTPTTSSSIVHASYLASDQRIYECPCPSCGDYHEIMWRDIKWPEGRPQEAQWCCPSCGVFHADACKRDMAEAGRWRITMPEVKGHAGFKLNCLIAPHQQASWPRLAEEFLIAKRHADSLKPFIQTILGEIWVDDDQDGPLPHELQALSEPISLDNIPREVLYLTSGCDVQHDRIEISTIGFSETDAWFCLSHQILIGDPLRDPVWSDLADLLQERYDHPSGGSFGRDAIGIDAADGTTTDRVMQFVAGHRNLRAIALKGASGSRPPLVPTASKRSRGLMICGVDMIKGRIYDRLSKRSGIVFSDELPLSYFEQLTSERRVTRFSRGQPHVLFERYPGKLSESLDCLTYAVAVRSAVAIDPARRQAELGSKIALKPRLPVTIRSAWLEGR